MFAIQLSFRFPVSLDSVDRDHQMTSHNSQGDKTYFLLQIVISIMVASTDLIDESPVIPSA